MIVVTVIVQITILIVAANRLLTAMVDVAQNICALSVGFSHDAPVSVKFYYVSNCVNNLNLL